MPLTIIDASGPIVSARISGELARAEMSQMQAATLEAIRRCGTASALLILEDFAGWKSADDWGDIGFFAEHDSDIARIAVVGEEKWRDRVYAFVGKGYRQAQVEYFPPAGLAKARAWLDDGTRR